jgi:hypothetical protein
MIESTYAWELLQGGCQVQPVQPGGVVVTLRFHALGAQQFRRQADSYLADRLDSLDLDLAERPAVAELVNLEQELRRTRARLAEIPGERADAHITLTTLGRAGGPEVGRRIADALAARTALGEEEKRLKGEALALERRATECRAAAQSAALTVAGSHLARAAADAREERAEIMAALPRLLEGLLDKVVILAEIESLSRLPASAAQEALGRLLARPALEPVAAG